MMTKILTIGDIVIGDETNSDVTGYSWESSISSDAEQRGNAIKDTLVVKGVIRTASAGVDDFTLKLAEWSRVSPNAADAYQPVSIEAFNAGHVTRLVEFSDAFLVSYKEGFDDTMGSFEITVRQRRDKMAGIKVSGNHPR